MSYQFSVLIPKLAYFIDAFIYKENVECCRGSKDNHTHTHTNALIKEEGMGKLGFFIPRFKTKGKKKRERAEDIAKGSKTSALRKALN